MERRVKLKELSYEVGCSHPYFVVIKEFRNSKWEISHIHYHKYKFIAQLQMWFESEIKIKIRNWFIRRKK